MIKTKIKKSEWQWRTRQQTKAQWKQERHKNKGVRGEGERHSQLEWPPTSPPLPRFSHSGTISCRPPFTGGAPRLCLPVHFWHTRNPTHVAPPRREARPMIGCHLLSAHRTAVWMSKDAGECQNYGIGNSHNYAKTRGAFWVKSWVCSGSK